MGEGQQCMIAQVRAAGEEHMHGGMEAQQGLEAAFCLFRGAEYLTQALAGVLTNALQTTSSCKHACHAESCKSAHCTIYSWRLYSCRPKSSSSLAYTYKTYSSIAQLSLPQPECKQARPLGMCQCTASCQSAVCLQLSAP